MDSVGLRNKDLPSHQLKVRVVWPEQTKAKFLRRSSTTAMNHPQQSSGIPPPPPGMPRPPPGLPAPPPGMASTSSGKNGGPMSRDALAKKSNKWIQMQNKRYSEKRKAGFVDPGKQVS
jgi:hypothetical protein